MKKTIRKSFNIKRKVIITAVVALAIVALVFTIVGYIYQTTVRQCYDNLYNQTAMVKTELYMQMSADSEQLKTIANFASPVFQQEDVRVLYKALENNNAENIHFDNSEDDFAPVFNSFRKNGIIDELEILVPGDILITASGTYEVGDFISFKETVKLGEHISNLRRSYISKNKRVIHNAVPIVLDGETVAVLMGVSDVARLGTQYSNLLKYEHAHMQLVDGKTGEFIFNSDHMLPGRVDDIYASQEAKVRYMKALKTGDKGSIEYMSKHDGKYVFATYDSLNINDWRVIVAMPEEAVFAEARATIKTIAILSAALILLMGLYVWFLMVEERKRLRLSLASSSVRKLLLEFGQRNESLRETLELICDIGNARSAFFVDTDRDEYDFIRQEYIEFSLDMEERYAFVDYLANYADNKKRDLFVKEIIADAPLKETNPELYSLMEAHNITNTVFTVIWDKNNHAGVICVINSKKSPEAALLLGEIAMCFSMTVYNKKYLSATEHAAITDTLTGLTNRTGYNRDMISLKLRDYRSLVCVYIDVNELHSYNNKYGHLAGDNMLVYVSKAIEEQFAGHKLYRWGGDEFIVFAENISEQEVLDKISSMKQKIEANKYHVSIGYSYTDEKKDVELLLNEAEKKMYEAKAKYYQDKSNRATLSPQNPSNINHVATGNAALDAALSVMSQRYFGIYAVSLEDDSARIILIPESFDNILEERRYFSKAMEIYIANQVSPDYHRALNTFMNYEVIKNTLAKGIIPTIMYKKLSGEEITLTVHMLDNDNCMSETLWVFEKED